jgi:hypothetical protein
VKSWYIGFTPQICPKKISNAEVSHMAAQVEAHASKPAFALKRMSVFTSFTPVEVSRRLA